MLYDFRCTNGHVTEVFVRHAADRDLDRECRLCGAPLVRTLSAPHCLPDGMYSYAPNVGNADAFELRQIRLRETGERVAEKIA